MRKYWNFDGSQLVFQFTNITTRQKCIWTSFFYVFGKRHAQFTSFVESESETFIEYGPLGRIGIGKKHFQYTVACDVQARLEEIKRCVGNLSNTFSTLKTQS